MRYTWTCAALICVLASAPVLRADVPPAKLRAAKCPLCTKPVVPACQTEYKDCSLYFCSDECKSEFDESDERLCERANEQLVTTGQFVPVEEIPPARLRTAQCPVCANAVSAEESIVYNDCPLYFCGERCSDAFATAPTRYVPRANAQLFSTQQFRQTSCPLCPQPIVPAQSCKVAGANVSFCSRGCRDQVVKLKPDAAVTTVFAKANFTKKFKKVVKVG